MNNSTVIENLESSSAGIIYLVMFVIILVLGSICLAAICCACFCPSELVAIEPRKEPDRIRRDIDPLSKFVYNTQRPVEQPEKHTVNVYIGTIARVEGQTQDVNMRAEGQPDNVV